MASELDDKNITPDKLIEQYSLAEHLEFADQYFDGREDHAYLYQKPFHSPTESGSTLGNLGQLFDGIKLQSGMKVLDFATGSCWLSKILVEFGCIVTSSDVSVQALSIGKELFKHYPPINKQTPLPNFSVFNGEKLDETDRFFDRIIVNDAFHHVPNTTEVLKEFYRVLKPNGMVAMSEPGRFHSQTEASQFEMKTYNVIENDFVLEDIWSEAQAAGFDRIEVAPVLRNTLLSMDEYQALITGEVSDLTRLSLQQNTINHSIFFLYKDKEITEETFNEKRYLELNPDVAEAVKNKIIESGFKHYMANGKTEGRLIA